MRSPVADRLADLSRAFSALDMPWYLFGAQAAIVYGVLAGRPKDLDDLATLLRVQRSTIDGARVRKVLGLLEQALGQSDLVPAFDHALRRVG